MGEIQQVQLCVEGMEGAESPAKAEAPIHPPLPLKLRQWEWWLKVCIGIAFLLSGQAVATMLGRLYFDKGGNSKWFLTLAQYSGFPVFLPFYLFHNRSKPAAESPQPPISTLAAVYTFFGLLIVGNTLLYAYGLQYLPVSTYSLISASQLAFNAVFSYFINAQKFTPLILNSIVLLTFSATLLVIQPDQATSTHSRIPPGKYTIGFICTVAASACYSLVLSLIQLTFQKILKKETLSAVLEIQIYPSLVATCGGIVGLFASGQWRDLKGEMDRFGKGEVAYLMTMIWYAVASQLYSVGAIMLVYQVSSLFCNVIITLGLPIVPILALIFFHDGLGGVKIVAMLLAVWGFISYIYQQHLEDSKEPES